MEIYKLHKNSAGESWQLHKKVISSKQTKIKRMYVNMLILNSGYLSKI